MTISIGAGGAWKRISGAWVGAGGAWKRVESIKVGVGGVWRDVYVDDDVVTAPNVSVSAFEISPTDAQASFRMGADGHWYTSDTSVISYVDRGSWITPNSRANAYEVRFTVTAGSTPSGDPTGTWLAMSADRTWTLRETTNGLAIKSTTFTLEIRRAADGVVVSTTTNNKMSARTSPSEEV